MQLDNFRRHAEWALAAATAHQLGLLDALAEAPATAEHIARQRGLSPRGARILLGVLDEMGLVEEDAQGGFDLTGPGRAGFVDRDSGRFQGDALRQWTESIRTWANELPDAVRRGGPATAPEAAGTAGTADPEALGRFMAAMNNKPAAQVEAVVDTCLARAPRARSMLDLGGGPGTFARAFARRGLAATLFDRPAVIRYVADAFGLADEPNLRLETGDFVAAPPPGQWDVVLLANITHIYGAQTNARLLRDVAGGVRPGGILAVLDFVRGQSEFAPLFAITMLLNTEQGDTYTRDQYRHWLQDAGLRDVRLADVDPDVQLLTAVRPAE